MRQRRRDRGMARELLHHSFVFSGIGEMREKCFPQIVNCAGRNPRTHDDLGKGPAEGVSPRYAAANSKNAALA